MTARKMSERVSTYPDHKMDKRIKNKWVKALRSGEYAQIGGQLCREGNKEDKHDAFCCLGVLHNIAVLEGITDWEGRFHDGSLTKKVAEWSGLKIADKDIIPYEPWEDEKYPETPEDALIALNDEEEQNFREIANWIEANL